MQELQEFRSNPRLSAREDLSSNWRAAGGCREVKETVNPSSQGLFEENEGARILQLLSNSEVRRAPVASQIFTRLARGVLLNSCLLSPVSSFATAAEGA